MKEFILKRFLWLGCVFVAILFIDLIFYTVDMIEALSLIGELEQLGADYEVVAEAFASTEWELWRTFMVKICTMFFACACMVGFFQLDDKIDRLYKRKMDKPNQEPLDIGY